MHVIRRENIYIYIYIKFKMLSGKKQNTYGILKQFKSLKHLWDFMAICVWKSCETIDLVRP